MSMPAYGPNKGSTTGFRKYEFIVHLFDQQHKKKLSDAKLVKALQKEFPECKTDWAKNISYLRNLYNRGKLRFQLIRPAKNSQCQRYDAKGQVIPHKKGPPPARELEDN